MDWQALILKLCALRDELALMDNYDSEHPVFTAIDRTRPGMSKEDVFYVDNVLGFYREQFDLQQLVALPLIASDALLLAHLVETHLAVNAALAANDIIEQDVDAVARLLKHIEQRAEQLLATGNELTQAQGEVTP